jgi:hypothetical protein
MRVRMLAIFLVLMGFLCLNVGGTRTSTMTRVVAEASSVTTEDCKDDEWLCSEPYKDSDGILSQDCFCPVNGLTIHRPVF